MASEAFSKQTGRHGFEADELKVEKDK